ncbi:MAG: ATP-binding protein [Pseudomonadota bacterium]
MPVFTQILLALAPGGRGRQDDIPFVSLEAPMQAVHPGARAVRVLRVGVAPVFSAVAAYEHYAPLTAWLSQRLERPVDVVQRGTYHEMNELTRRGAVDAAFVCSGPWLLSGDGLAVLAVPMIQGSPTYQAVCLVPVQQGAIESEGAITLSARRDGEHGVVAERDDGPGVPAELAPRLFDPFFTTKEPGRGTGLGLSVSQELVSAMGGRLFLLPGDGPGACFEIWFPLEVSA